MRGGVFFRVFFMIAFRCETGMIAPELAAISR
jgi:hypothetical protein